MMEGNDGLRSSSSSSNSNSSSLRNTMAIPTRGTSKMPRVQSMSSITPTAEDEVKSLTFQVSQLEKIKAEQTKQLSEYKRRLKQMQQFLNDQEQQLKSNRRQLKVGKRGKGRNKQGFFKSQDDIKIGLNLNDFVPSSVHSKLNLSGSGSSFHSNASLPSLGLLAPTPTPSPTRSQRKQKPSLTQSAGGKKRNNYPDVVLNSGSTNVHRAIFSLEGSDGDNSDDDESEEDSLAAFEEEYDNEEEDEGDERKSPQKRLQRRFQRTWSAPPIFSHSPEMLSHSPTTDKIQTFFNRFEQDATETLFRACAEGNLPILEGILADSSAKAKVDLNSKRTDPNTSSRYTPLALAIKNRNLEVAGLLVASGANVDEPDSGGNTALHLSLTNLQLREGGTDSDHLMPLIETIIQRTKKVDHQNELGNTPLLLAVHNSCSRNDVERENYERIAKALLEKGANVNLKNKYHECALLLAAKEGSLEIVTMCLNQPNVEIDILDKFGNTPLFYAAQHSNQAICQKLAESGANLRLENEQGKTPLSVATDPQVRKILEDYDPRSKHWKWLIPLEDLEIRSTEVLGEGKFSTCVLGKLYGTYVAVKQYKFTKSAGIDQFQHEVGLMSEIKHPNVLLFLGACFSKKNNQLCIITEFLRNGSLRRYLESNMLFIKKTTGLLNRHLLYKFAITTARGMAWLHSRKPVLLHRDLHANNILLTPSLECKVADLGLSQIELNTSRTEDHIFYQRTNPPEIKKGDKYSTASDIYQYGLVLYELLLLEKAGQDIEIESIELPTRGVSLWNTTSSLTHSNENLGFYNDILELMKSCCREYPSDRPGSFVDIIDQIETVCQEMSEEDRKIVDGVQKLSATNSCPDGEYIE